MSAKILLLRQPLYGLPHNGLLGLPAGGCRTTQAAFRRSLRGGPWLAPRVKRRSGLARPRSLRPETPPATTQQRASPPGPSLFSSLAWSRSVGASVSRRRGARWGPAASGAIAASPEGRMEGCLLYTSDAADE